MKIITDQEHGSSCLDIVHNIRLGALSKFRYNPRAVKSQKQAFKYIDNFVDEAIALRSSNLALKGDVSSKYTFLHTSWPKRLVIDRSCVIKF